MILFLFVPLAIIILLSFNTSAVPAFPMRGLTLQWYGRVFSNNSFRAALVTSVKVAGMTALFGTMLGTFAATAFARHRFRGRGSLMTLLFAPLAMPGLITGVAMLTVYVAVGFTLSIWTITIGHLVYATPFVVLAIVAGLSGLDPSLEESGRDLGRTPFGVFRKVTFPLVFPVIIGAAFVAAALSLDEFIITNFISGSTVTLPLYIWSKLRIGVTPDTNAVGTLILVGLTVLSLGIWYLTRLTSTLITRTGGSRMKRLRVGVIGLGAIAQIHHLSNLEQLSDRFEIGHVCDLSPQLVEAIGERYGVRRRSFDWREACSDPDLDAVVLLNSGSHGPQARMALENGLHVFAEKPSATRCARRMSSRNWRTRIVASCRWPT